jgi:hypothetical protein
VSDVITIGYLKYQPRVAYSCSRGTDTTRE